MATKRAKDIRGIQFDELTLDLVDDLCRRRGVSRSQLIRDLIRKEAASDAQLALPGMGAADQGDGV